MLMFLLSKHWTRYHLNPPVVDKFTFFEEIGYHKEILMCVLGKVIKNIFFKYEILIEI